MGAVAIEDVAAQSLSQLGASESTRIVRVTKVAGSGGAPEERPAAGGDRGVGIGRGVTLRTLLALGLDDAVRAHLFRLHLTLPLVRISTAHPDADVSPSMRA